MSTRNLPFDPNTGGRPRLFDRDKALDKAILLFWQHGYEGVSIAMLTSAIGIAPPSLYAAFGSKAALFQEAIKHYSEFDGGGEPIPKNATAYETVKAALQRGVRVVTQRGRPRGCMISSGMLAAGPENAELIAEVSHYRKAFLAMLERRIKRDIKAALLPGDTDARALARMYVSVMQGMSIQALDGASAKELAKLVDLALRAWPHGTTAHNQD